MKNFTRVMLIMLTVASQSMLAMESQMSAKEKFEQIKAKRAADAAAAVSGSSAPQKKPEKPPKTFGSSSSSSQIPIENLRIAPPEELRRFMEQQQKQQTTSTSSTAPVSQEPIDPLVRRPNLPGLAQEKNQDLIQKGYATISDTKGKFSDKRHGIVIGNKTGLDLEVAWDEASHLQPKKYTLGKSDTYFVKVHPSSITESKISIFAKGSGEEPLAMAELTINELDKTATLQQLAGRFYLPAGSPEQVPGKGNIFIVDIVNGKIHISARMTE